MTEITDTIARAELLAKIENHIALGLDASPGFFLSMDDLKEIAKALRNNRASSDAPWNYVDIVFDNFPSHHMPRFIEVENSERKSIRFGEWIERADGGVVLRVPCSARASSVPSEEALRNALLDILDANHDFVQGMGPHFEGDPLTDACDRARALLTGSSPVNAVSEDELAALKRDAERYRFLRDARSYYYGESYAEPSPREFGIQWDYQDSTPARPSFEEVLDADVAVWRQRQAELADEDAQTSGQPHQENRG
jgi:hypothetical protein